MRYSVLLVHHLVIPSASVTLSSAYDVECLHLQLIQLIVTDFASSSGPVMTLDFLALLTQGLDTRLAHWGKGMKEKLQGDL